MILDEKRAMTGCSFCPYWTALVLLNGPGFRLMIDGTHDQHSDGQLLFSIQPVLPTGVDVLYILYVVAPWAVVLVLRSCSCS